MATPIGLTLLPDSSNSGKPTSGIIRDDWVAGQMPVISGSSGALTNGSIITIVGSNFSKKTIAQTFFSDFRNDAIDADPAGFFKWTAGDWGSDLARYKVAAELGDPFGRKGIKSTANKVQIKYTHFEFAQPQDEVFVEMWCRINRVAWFSGSQWSAESTYLTDDKVYFERPIGEPAGGNIHCYTALNPPPAPGVAPWDSVNNVVGTGWQTIDQPQIKMTRVVRGTGQYDAQGLSGIDCIQESGGVDLSGGPLLAAAEDGIESGGTDRRGYGATPSSDAWVKQTFYCKRSDLDTPNGKAYIKIGSAHKFSNSGHPANGHLGAPDGSLISSMHLYDSTPFVNNQTGKSNVDLVYQRVMLPYYQRQYQNTEISITNFYVNTSPERVVIGDASTWNACDHTKTYTVPTVSRDNGLISFEFLTSSLITSSRYAYVVNRDGIYNQNGFALEG